MDIENIIKRYNNAKQEKIKWDQLYKDAYDIALPHRNQYRQYSTNKTDKIFDSTAMICVNNFVSNMQNNLTPSFKKWARLEAGDVINSVYQQDINNKLNLITDIIFTVINASNFSNVISEIYYDLCCLLYTSDAADES